MIADYGLAPRDVLEAAKARAMTAIDLAPEEARCHRILGYVRSHARGVRRRRAGRAARRRAQSLRRRGDDAHEPRARHARPRAEALDWIDRAIALNPLHPPYYHHIRSFPLYLLGRYDECAAELDARPAPAARAEVRMAATLAMAGRDEEAARQLDRAEALEPDLRHMEAARASYRCERAEDLEHLLAGIRAALERAGAAAAEREARRERSGEGGLGLLDDGAEGGGLVHGEIGQHLAVDLDAGLGRGRR